MNNADMIQDIYSLTPLQEGMLYHSIINDSGNYVLQKLVGLSYKLDVEILKKAVDLLSERYDVLRTSIIYEKVKEPKQVVLKKQNHKINTVDLSEYSGQDLEEALDELLEKDVRKGFDLQRDPLIRFTYCDLQGNGSKLLVTIHHIIVDGWCMQTIITRLQDYYVMLQEGSSYDEISSLIADERKNTGEYKDYVRWIKKTDDQIALSYWNSLVARCENVSSVIPMRPSSDSHSTKSAATSVILDADTTAALNELAKECHVTFNSIIEIVCGLLLCKYSNSVSSVFGKVVSGREAPVKNIENIVGLFINTIPVIADFSEKLTVREAIKAQHLQSIESSKYDYCSLADIQSRSVQGKDLIKFLYVFESFSSSEESAPEPNGSDDDTIKFEYVKSQTGYDITFNASFFDKCLKLSTAYNISKYDNIEIELMLKKMICIFKSVAESPDAYVADIFYVSEDEKNTILGNFNSTEADYPKDKNAAELFEEQVSKTPDNIAVSFCDRSLTYSELDKKSDIIAGKLRKLGVKSNDFVAIISDRSLEMIIGVYGIVKSGAAYVPIDPTYPSDRINFMLDDCAPKAVLKYTSETVLLPDSIPVIELGDESLWNEAADPVELISKPNDILYCIYTSGTTGQPKGVMLENRSVINHLNVMREKFYSSDVKGDTPLFTSFAFDFTIPAIFGTILFGDKLVVMKDVEQLAVYSEKNILSVLKITPSYFNGIYDMFTNHNGMVDTIVFGGETLTSETLRNVHQAFGHNIRIFNEYGPTETTVFTTAAEIYDGDIITIGKPVSNSNIYIMNGSELCGIGIPGEICIAGDGVARGYLNRPELNAEKFTENPFGDGRIYHSGDLARWLIDGNIDYLGRVDEQVKIRGFRVELGEIENKLREIDKIKDCAVIVKADITGDKALCAYYTSDENVSIFDVKDKLGESLPNYMIPAYMMQIDSIPFTQNGKLDRRALPKIEKRVGNEYAAPENETQDLICGLFCDILGVEKVGINDDFFELGGHSLRATRLVNRIEAKINVKIQLRNVFLNATPKKLALLAEKALSTEYVPIPKAEVMEYYPMSSSQKRTYLIQQLEPDSIVYNMPRSIRLSGDVRPDDIKLAIQTIVDRHEILRTALLIVNGEAVQKVMENVKIDFKVLSSESSDEELINTFVRPFDLSSPPLIRGAIVNKGDHWLLIVDMHHVVSDAVSMNVIVNEFNILYSGGTPEPLRCQYKDYSEWMRKRDFSSQAEYWRSQFADEIPVLDMTTDFPRPQMQSYSGRSIALVTDEQTSKGIKELSKITGTTDYMIFLAALMVTLSKYSRQEDIVIGSPVSGRTHKDIENMLGMFVNTLAMRAFPQGSKTFNRFLEEIKELCLNAYANQEYPFEELVETLNVTRELSRNPVFDVMLTIHNAENNELTDDDLDAETIANDMAIAKMDMSFDVQSGEDGYVISLEYCTDLFRNDTAEGIMEHYINVIKTVISDRSRKICDIDMCTEVDRQKVFGEFNNTAFEHPNNITVVDMLEEKAEIMPDKTAIQFDGVKISFKELNERANRLGKHLRSKGIGTNDFVMLITERSPQMLEAVYGVLKSGAAYVPVDPNTPDDRIEFMINDCNAKAIVTYGNEFNINTPAEIIRYEDIEKLPSENCAPSPSVSDSDAAYIIYTSGTTGQPKGVVIEHRNLTNLLYGYEKTYGMSCDDVVLQFASYCFDQSVWEIFSIVKSGNAVCSVPSEYIKDFSRLAEYAEKEGVTVMLMTPTYIKLLDAEQFGTLRLLDSGGEAGDLDVLKKWKKVGKRVINTYGPTETTVNATSFEISCDYERILIGRPMANFGVYMLNGNSLCGIGVPGELCITGEGVARGYLNRQELTAEKFVDNPFGEGKMYRSGDLARWLPDGNIEYLGRIDEQVKIRGFRIELGEIESRIRSIKDINECAITVKTDASGDKAIYAYYTSDKEISASAVRDELRITLPGYMIPAYMMQIEEIPVTRNGKLNKNALPDIEGRIGFEYEAPINETQKIICDIFTQILGAEKVGIKDSFFELGGHSLRATRLVNFIEEKTGVRLAIRDIFISSTPEQIAELVESMSKAAFEAIPKAENKDFYPMSSTQRRMYILQEMMPDLVSYNINSAIYLGKGVDEEKLRHALSRLVERHEILRTKFDIINDEPVQIILDSVDIEIERINCINKDPNELYKEFVRPFILSEPPLLRVALVVDENECTTLFYDIHHIIFDGFSSPILEKELIMLYNGKQLDDNVVQYKDYSEWMRSRDLSSQKEFWLGQFEDDIPVLDLPLDNARGKYQSFNGDEINFSFEDDISIKIHNFMREKNASSYMVFLCALMITLSKSARQDDIVVGTAISGRTHRDTEKIIGMFVNTIAMRGRPSDDKSFSEFLDEIKESCFNAFENQDYPFEDLVDQLDMERDMARNPLFDVMFTVQNNELTDESIDIETDDTDESESRTVTERNVTAKFDITITVLESENSFNISLVYCSDLFNRESMELFVQHYLCIMEQLISESSRKLKEAELITDVEREKILSVFNETEAPYPKTKTIVDMFEEQVKNNPNKTVVEFRNESLTFAEFDSKVNRLAHTLRKNGVQPEDFVVIIADRSIEMIVGIYGILKAGGAYVPIDTSYPEERIKFMFEDCNPKALVKFTSENISIPENIIVINLADSNSLDECEDTPEHIVKPENPVYCIYTSGTTGNPKGVVVEHRNVINFITPSEKNFFQKVLCDNCDCLYFTNKIIFDITVMEIFMSICNGKKVVISEDELGIISKQESMKLGNKAGFLTTPSKIRASLAENADYIRQFSLIMVGAERLTYDVINAITEKSEGIIINGYGPTETTCGVSYYICPREESVISIGRPIANTKMYILSGDGLCGIGVPGEICITGDCISRGYLNRQKLTEEKFVDSPFGDGRMYRTGDLARWLPDGNIEYLGRIDDQVKIRGFRIELCDIETHIRKIEGITSCAVITRADLAGDNAIYAYITGDEKIDISYLRNCLEDSLPEYMIPPYIMQIDEIPITASGKLDKRALPEIKAVSSVEYVAPSNDFEREVCDIFASVLGAERIGLSDSFYSMGGDSIKAVRIISKLREKGYKLLVSDIMRNKTIGKCLGDIRAFENDINYEQGEVTGIVGKTPILRFFESLKLACPQHFNQSKVIDVTEISDDIVKEIITNIVTHHDMMRAVYRNGSFEVLSTAESKMFDMYSFDMTSEEYTAEELFRKCTEIQASIDIENGPVVKAAIFDFGDERKLLIIVHHIAIDTVSWQILREDFETIYNEISEGKDITLPPKTASYIEWSKTLEEYKTSEIFEKNKAYWDKIIENGTDHKFNHLKKAYDVSPETKEYQYIISAEEVENFKEAGEIFNANINEMLLSALALAVNMISGQSMLTVSIESYGRENLHKEILIDRTIGWFTNIYPIVLECSGEIRDIIVNNKEIIRKIPKNGFDYGLIDSAETDSSDILCFNYTGESVSSDKGDDNNDNINIITGGAAVSEKNILKNNIVLNMSLQNGSLYSNVQYNTAFYCENDINELMDKFREAVNKIANYCLNINDNVYSASDFDNTMDNEDFANLLDLI